MIRHSISASGADLAAHRGPAEHRRHRARGAADDDVLRRQRLQHHGVDDRVADEGGERQPHRQRIDRNVQQRAAGGARAAAENSSVWRVASARRVAVGAPRGARHARVDALLDQAVERRRRARRPARCRRRRPAPRASRASPGRPAACRSRRRRRSAAPRAAWSARSTGAARDGSATARRTAGERCRTWRSCDDSSEARPQRRASAGTRGAQRRGATGARRAQQHGQQHHQRRGAAGVRRPPRRSGQPSTHVATARSPAASASAASAGRERRASASPRRARSRQASSASAAQHHDGAEAVRHVDRGQRRERQAAAVAGRAELAAAA